MLRTFHPKSKQLQKYIELFYVFTPEKPRHISYIAFPHVNTSLSFLKGVKISRGNYEITFLSDAYSQGQCSIEVLGKYTRPVFVHYNGDFEEIAIVFKPFGMNHFFSNNLVDIAPAYSQVLTIESWNQFSNVLFNAKGDEIRMEMLEEFLLKHFFEKENEQITMSITYLSDAENNYTVQEVADKVGMNLKTFQRHFLKHMTCSPSEYKRIARFRDSLQTRLFSDEIKSLTHLTYKGSYYDQSYFIREFKKLTHQNPKSFFDTISVLDQKKIIWKIK